MCNSSQQSLILSTPKGEIDIRSFCTAAEIQSFSFDNQFGTYAQYKSLYTKRETLEKNAGVKGTNVVVALADRRHIVGFGVLAYPDPEERWAQLGPNRMIEVRAIEVCRNWRAFRVGNAIVQMLLAYPEIETKIVYVVGYVWTWDLDGTGKTAQEYRTIIIKLFEHHGFQEFQTNDPNICLKPENVFMGRIGAQVSDNIKTDFKWIRFGIPPENPI